MAVPRHLAGEVALEGEPMEAFNDLVWHEALRDVAIIGLYPATDPDIGVRVEAWKAARP